jgi:quercetin 2,3-dioxygenase
VTRKYTDEQKTDKLVRIMESVDRHSGSETEDAPIPLHADLSMDASILSPGKSVTHEIVKDGERNLYAHVVMTDKKQPADGAKIRIGDVELGEGDGAFIEGAKGPGKIEISSVGSKPAEFILFDLGLDEE